MGDKSKYETIQLYGYTFDVIRSKEYVIIVKRLGKVIIAGLGLNQAHAEKNLSDHLDFIYSQRKEYKDTNEQYYKLLNNYNERKSR